MKYGHASDNFLGRSPQINHAQGDWVSFFATTRLEFQLTLLKRTGQNDSDLKRKVHQLMDRLDEFLDPHVANCLLHGDLWSGNYLSDAVAVYLIDPAIYWGDRETDLAMTRLFGGYSAAFYAAYEAEWPLTEGWETRVDIYQLYHLINHLNLFGSGYLGQCHQLVDRILRN